jgi:hypothetical protein
VSAGRRGFYWAVAALGLALVLVVWMRGNAQKASVAPARTPVPALAPKLEPRAANTLPSSATPSAPVAQPHGEVPVVTEPRPAPARPSRGVPRAKTKHSDLEF